MERAGSPPPQIVSIEQRIAQRAAQRTGSDPNMTGRHLGFGLVLEKQQAAAQAGSVRAGWNPASTSLLQTWPGQGVMGAPIAGGVASAGPPAELVPYGNGRVPLEALAPVGTTGHRLWAPAAANLEALIADARRSGIAVGITDSYRPLEVQERLAREKGLYKNGGLAAVPGTSNHGWGIATDLDLDPAAQQWMRANASRYGFVEDVPREPWHWTFRPSY